MQINFNPEHNHLWPVILEQSYDAFKQTKKTGFSKDIFNLSLTSSSIFKSVYETAITLNIRMVEETFKDFLLSVSIYNPNIKFIFDPCKNFFDVQIEKIKMLGKMYLLLNHLSDTTKVYLRDKLSEKPGEMIFRSSIRALMTDEEIDKEKDFSSTIQSLITTAQFEKAYKLLFKHKSKYGLCTMENVKYNLNNIVAMDDYYCLLHYPQLRPLERAMVVRYIFQNIPFEKNAMVHAIKTLTKRYDDKEVYSQLAITSYFTCTLDQLFQENNTSKLKILKSVCLSFHWLQNCYEDTEDNFNLKLIDNLLSTHSFNSALKLQQNLNNCSKREDALRKIIDGDICLKLHNYDYQGAVDMSCNHINENYRNESLCLITETAILGNLLDFAQFATASITKNAIETKDSLYFKILINQKFNDALKTFELIKNKQNYIPDFCLIIPDLIEKSDIPKALKIIDTLPNNKTRQKALNRIQEVYFPEYNVSQWLEFGSNINNFDMRLKFLNDFFKGCQKEEFHHFFKNADAFYIDFSKILMSADLTKAMNFIDTLAYTSEKMIALHLLVDRLFPFQEIYKFLEAIYKSNLSNLSDVEAIDVEAILDKMSTKTISIAMDIVNSISDVKYRLGLLKLIYIRMNPDDDVEMIESTLKEINDNDNPDERRENLSYLIC